MPKTGWNQATTPLSFARRRRCSFLSVPPSPSFWPKRFAVSALPTVRFFA